MSKILRFIHVISSTATYLSGFLIFLMIIFVFLSVVARYIFNSPFSFTEELTGYIVIFAICMGLGYTFRTNGHIRTTILFDRLPSRYKKGFTLIGLVLSFLWSVVMLVAAKSLIAKYLTNETVSITPLHTPLWIPAVFIGIGSFILCLDIIVKVIECFQTDQVLQSNDNANVS
ncbi:TRAP transporter small permease [Peribacillus aracenensis]|uniref:TRAP transporter small permease n=1 Tax=Peribacillus aracenensis TaxID=2976708 RepID=UPI0021A6D7E2|nr:TRAP transporter small permease [Peribacillus sp. BBB004]